MMAILTLCFREKVVAAAFLGFLKAAEEFMDDLIAILFD